MTKYRIVYMPSYDTYSVQEQGLFILWRELYRWPTLERAIAHVHERLQFSVQSKMPNEVIWKS